MRNLKRGVLLCILSFSFFNPNAQAVSEEEALILSSPTNDIETYEETRKDLLRKSKLPKWSFNVGFSPLAFRDTDFRTPAPDATTSEFHHPNIHVTGFHISLEKTMFRRAGLGLLSVGLEGGVYFGQSDALFEQMFPAMFSGAPYVMWQAVFLNNQWVVPFVRAEYAAVRYDYKFNKLAVKGVKQVPRGDAGLLFFLNVLEPSSAVELENNYDIKRTYLSAAYTILKDTSKKDFDLSEQTFRFGLRLEY